MNLDLQTAKANLAKAKEDVLYWEDLLRLLSDPRIAGARADATVRTATSGVLFSAPQQARPYGDLKRRVLAALPEWGAPGVSTSQLVAMMEASGYTFVSKTPATSVNEALVTLEEEGLSFMASKHGPTRFWTKMQPPRESGGQQQTPP